jgi:hypothetical protein
MALNTDVRRDCCRCPLSRFPGTASESIFVLFAPPQTPANSHIAMDALEPAPADPPCLLLTLPRELLSKVVLLTVDKFEEPLWTYSLSAR